MRHGLLDARNNVTGPIGTCARGDVRECVASPGFRVGERELLQPLRDGRQHPLPLLVAAAARDELRAERNGGEPRLDDQRIADCFHHIYRIHRTATEAAVRSGN